MPMDTKSQLSIVIPTIGESEHLGRAIDSVKLHAPVECSLTVSYNGFGLSKFESLMNRFGTSVEWRCTDAPRAPLHESLNYAVRQTDGKYCFILSDDDTVLPGFAAGFETWDTHSTDLFMTRLEVVDTVSGTTRVGIGPGRTFLRGHEAIAAFVHAEMYHHLSLFVFPRSLFEEVGGFSDTGYPNGYFVDIVAHAKLLARARAVHVEQAPVVARYLTPVQGAARFYVGKEVNDYMRVIMNDLWSDPAVRSGFSLWWSSAEELRRNLLSERFFREWFKANQSVYGNSRRLRWKLLGNFVFTWELPLKVKFLELLHLASSLLQQRISKIVKRARSSHLARSATRCLRRGTFT